MKLPNFLRALSSRNYRLYFFGQCVSILGSWMSATASTWLIYKISGKAFDIAIVAFANQLPVILFAPFVGIWIDRLDPLRLLKITQFSSMVQSIMLAVLTLTGHLNITSLVALSFAQGLVNSMDWPVRQTLTHSFAGDPTLIDNVIALNSITFNLARLIGPAIAGYVIYRFGAGNCFVLDAISFLAVLGALYLVRIAPPPPRRKHAHPFSDFSDGLRYVRSHGLIRRILIMVAIIGFAGFAHSLLASVFAADVFHGDAQTFGYLLSATGLGALAAGLFLSTRTPASEFQSIIIWGAVIGGAGLSAIASATHFSLALVGFAAAGAGSVLAMATSNTLVLKQVDAARRGRVMGLFTMCQGFMLLGNLTFGRLADLMGPRTSMLIAGIVVVAAGVVFAWSRSSALPQPQSA